MNRFIPYPWRLQPSCLQPEKVARVQDADAAAAAAAAAEGSPTRWCGCDLCSLPRVNRLGEQQTPRVNSADAPGRARLD